MIQKIFEIIGITVLFILFIISFVISFNYAWNKHETVECLTWIQQSKQFPGYYFTDWQYEQCSSHEIDLNVIY